MTEEFQRLGVFGDWEHPYLTMNFRYQAAIARALGKFVEQGLVYKGKKPVHWCIHCRTALAEAEVEYEDHSSPSIYVEFPLAPEQRGRTGARACRRSTGATSRSSSGRRRRGRSRRTWRSRSTRSSTTRAYEVGRPRRHRRRGARAERGGGCRHDLRPSRSRASRASCSRAPLPAPALRARLARRAGRLRHARAGHRRRAHGARATARTTSTPACKYGLEIYAPVGPGGHFLDTVELFAGQRVFDANPHVEQALNERGRLWHRADFAAPVPALLALPQPGDLPRDVAVVRRAWTASRRSPRDGARAGRCGRRGAPRHRSRRALDPGMGARPHLQHAGEPARLVHLAPARLGRADPGRRLHEVRRGGADGGARRARGRGVRRSTAPTRGTSGRSRSSCRQGLACPSCGGTRVRARARHPRRVVRLGVEPRGGAAVPARS